MELVDNNSTLKGQEMEDIYKNHLHAGYPGKDVMRENAKQAFDGEMRGFDSDIGMRGSFSAPSRTKMRLFKKGGHVSHQEKKLNKGGVIDGGSLTDMHFPKHMGFGKSPKSDIHLKKGIEMRKGGHFNKDEHQEYGKGGRMMKVYKTGGHTRPYAHGGSTMYERAMVGETNSHAKPRGNYESMMRGEECKHRDGYHAQERHEHRHEVLPGLKHGGHSHPRGKHARFAAGGVAKIRHEQSTPSGRQIATGPSKMKIY